MSKEDKIKVITKAIEDLNIFFEEHPNHIFIKEDIREVLLNSLKNE